jgi:hypothetical protein
LPRWSPRSLRLRSAHQSRAASRREPLCGARFARLQRGNPRPLLRRIGDPRNRDREGFGGQGYPKSFFFADGGPWGERFGASALERAWDCAFGGVRPPRERRSSAAGCWRCGCCRGCWRRPSRRRCPLTSGCRERQSPLGRRRTTVGSRGGGLRRTLNRCGKQRWVGLQRERRPVFRTDHSAGDAARKAKNPATGGDPPTAARPRPPRRLGTRTRPPRRQSRKPIHLAKRRRRRNPRPSPKLPRPRQEPPLRLKLHLQRSSHPPATAPKSSHRTERRRYSPTPSWQRSANTSWS